MLDSDWLSGCDHVLSNKKKWRHVRERIPVHVARRLLIYKLEKNYEGITRESCSQPERYELV